MKKIIVAAIAIAMLALTLCACGKVTCMTCGNEVSKSDAQVEEVFGEEIAICNDCLDLANSFLG